MTRRVLGRRASYYTAAAVVAHTIWTSAAPVLTYPLYADEWHLSTFTTTSIFAVYPILVVATLVVFGNLSDFIGRRETMLLGLVASAIGSLLFTVAPDVAWVLVGRAFMGIASACRPAHPLRPWSSSAPPARQTLPAALPPPRRPSA